MKTLILIISDDSQPVYAPHREVWRSYMRSDPSYECYFVTHRPDISEPRVIDDTFYAVGQEGFATILKKTADAMEYFLSRGTYDYVIRTNLSSVWIFRNLTACLETLPRSNTIYGCLGNVFNIQYVSGAGIIMTPDVCHHIIGHWRTAQRPDYDDIAIGWIAAQCGVKFVEGTRHNYDGNRFLTDDAYHIRAKAEAWENRHLEPAMMRAILAHYA
jgi:hypothetical protein